MKKVCKKWHVFLIVACMLVTMIPGSVFANDLITQQSVDQPLIDTLLTPGDDLGDIDQSIDNKQEDVDQGTGGEPSGEGDQGTGEEPPGEGDQAGVEDDQAETDQPGGDGKLNEETPQNEKEEQVLPEDNMLLQSELLYFAPTKLKIFYKENSNSGPDIEIKSVSYTDNSSGVTDLNNPHTVWIPDSFFGLKSQIKYDVSNYVPDVIIDKDDVKWVINDQGDGQSTNVNVKRWGKKNVQPFHYKKCETPPVPTTGSLTISKTISCEIPDTQIPVTTFTFNIAGPDGYTNTVNITGTDTQTISNLKPGDYSVTEERTDDFNPESGVYTKPAKVTAGTTETVYFTNYYTVPEPGKGSITITKVVEGDPMPETEETFNFTITTDGFSTTASITTKDSSAQTINNLQPGNYSISEVSIPSNYSLKEQNSRLVTVVSGGDSPITFTNVYDEPTSPPTTGSITITKEFDGDPLPETGGTFTFTIANDGFTTTASISSEDSYVKTIRNLPPGAYRITEINIPDHYSLKGENELPATVVAGNDYPVTFTNIYDDPTISDPLVRVIKRVAPYDGTTLPTGDRFTERLQLNELNKKVIYKISFEYNEEWDDYGEPIRLADIYDSAGTVEEITIHNLYVWDESQSKFVSAFDVYGYLHDVNLDEVFYFIDTLESNGTYTNTASIYESPQYRATSITVADSEIGYEALDSSSATVVVEYQKPSDDEPTGNHSGGGTSHDRYYEVTYDANYPAGAITSGTVPDDNKSYSYNNVVSVKGNTGELKAGNYTFDGWNTKADGSGTAYQAGNTFNIKDDITLYAQWKQGVEPLAADANAGTNDAGTQAVDTAGLDDVPKTGDNTPIIPIFLLGMISLAAVTVLSRKKTSENEIK